MRKLIELTMSLLLAAGGISCARCHQDDWSAFNNGDWNMRILTNTLTLESEKPSPLQNRSGEANYGGSNYDLYRICFNEAALPGNKRITSLRYKAEKKDKIASDCAFPDTQCVLINAQEWCEIYGKNPDDYYLVPVKGIFDKLSVPKGTKAVVDYKYYTDSTLQDYASGNALLKKSHKERIFGTKD